MKTASTSAGHHHLRLPLVVGAAMLALTISAQAQELIKPSPWSLSAYGSLTYSHEGKDRVNFVRDLDQEVKKPRSGSLLPDSRIGLQAGYRFSGQTDAVVQTVLRNKTDEELAHSIEWAYVSHRPTPELQMRLGRVGIDLFMLSDYRSLGYAQTSLRPNWDYYGFFSIYSVDGIDATWTRNTDDAIWRYKTQLGSSRTKLPISLLGATYDFKVKNFIDLTVERESGPLRLKVGAATMDVDTEAPTGPLTNGLLDVATRARGTAQLIPDPDLSASMRAIASEANGLRNSILFKGGRIDYLALGASYDDGEWLGQAEISRVSGTRDIYLHGTAFYLQAGRRIGAFTPFAGVSYFKPRNDIKTQLTNWGTTMDAAAGGDAGRAADDATNLQDGAIDMLNSPRINQRTLTLGLRWDFHTRAAFKVQWDHIKVKQYGYGLWGKGSTVDINTLNDDRVNLVSFGIDWVF